MDKSENESMGGTCDTVIKCSQCWWHHLFWIDHSIHPFMDPWMFVSLLEKTSKINIKTQSLCFHIPPTLDTLDHTKAVVSHSLAK